MGQTPDAVIHRWLAAVGKGPGVTGPARDWVVTAGDFLWKTGKLKLNHVEEALKGFDFSKPVKVINKLPNQVYVQYVQKHRGHWFTNTGLTQDAVGLAEGFRTRKLFKPAGAVCALKGTASGIRDFWSSDKLFKWLELRAKWEEVKARAEKEHRPLTDKHYEALKKRMGDMARGGGTQYFVPEKLKMTEV